jgi:hypothetical protein
VGSIVTVTLPVARPVTMLNCMTCGVVAPPSSPSETSFPFTPGAGHETGRSSLPVFALNVPYVRKIVRAYTNTVIAAAVTVLPPGSVAVSVNLWLPVVSFGSGTSITVKPWRTLAVTPHLW